MPTADEIRGAQRATWAGLSAGWEKWDSVIMDQLGPVSAAMIECLDIAEDGQHLDVAAGTGEPGLSIARLQLEGHVVLTDLVAEMLDIAARRASAQGLANVETKVCSADDLPFDDATFDSVSVRFGYMFFPDVARATAEFARVLKPGGRLCSSVWVKPESNPWTAIAMEAITTESVVAPPGPDGPGMFRCAAPGYVGALYEAAGLRDVSEWDVDVELVTRSPAEYWEMISEHVSLAVAALQQVGGPARERIRAHAIAKVSAFEKDGRIRVPGVARCIVGTKQQATGAPPPDNTRSSGAPPPTQPQHEAASGSPVERRVDDGLGHPAGDAERFVGFEMADVAQHHHGFDAGHEAERDLQAAEFVGGHGTAQRLEGVREEVRAATGPQDRRVTVVLAGGEPQVQVHPQRAPVQHLASEHVVVEPVEHLEEPSRNLVPTERPGSKAAALDAGVPLRDVQLAARHADPRTTTVYDHRRQGLDRHAAYVVVAFVSGG